MVYDDAVLKHTGLDKKKLRSLVEIGCKRAQDIHRRYSPEREWLPVGDRTVIFVMDPATLMDAYLWPPLNHDDEEKLSELKIIMAGDPPLEISQRDLASDHLRLLTALAQFTCTKVITRSFI